MATRSASGARNEVFDLLKADHRKVKQVFRKFEDIDVEGDPEGAQDMVLQACNDLEVHALLEEELFYPAVREAIKDTMIVAEAEVEHAGAKMLIAELRELDPSEEAFSASFTVLGEYVKHHIREEENEMFEQLERARIDWEALCDAMLERRETLMAGIGAEGVDDDEESALPAGAADPDLEGSGEEPPSDAAPKARNQGGARSGASTAKPQGSKSTRSR